MGKLTYKRYEFNDKAQATSKMDAFFTIDEDGNRKIQNGVWFKDLGHIELTSGVYDEDGLEITPPIFSSFYAIDVQWRFLDKSPYGWKTYEVTPSNPKHELY
tara:strand:+ start:552 stop:857 length:306 start_codon:yes stop_codon:yes gene_type:complete